MKLSWLSIFLHQKALVFLSVTSTLSLYIPTSLIPHLNGLLLVIIGWIMAVTITLFEYRTSVKETKADKKRVKSELYSKVMIYTLIFLSLKILHLWVIFDQYEYLAEAVNVLVIAIYALIVLGEFKLIGNNMIDRYGKKSRVFQHLDSFEEWILKYIIKRAEKACNLEDEKNN